MVDDSDSVKNPSAVDLEDQKPRIIKIPFLPFSSMLCCYKKIHLTPSPHLLLVKVQYTFPFLLAKILIALHNIFKILTKKRFKGTVSVISRNSSCKDVNVLFTMVPLKSMFLI